MRPHHIVQKTPGSPPTAAANRLLMAARIDAVSTSPSVTASMVEMHQSVRPSSELVPDPEHDVDDAPPPAAERARNRVEAGHRRVTALDHHASSAGGLEEQARAPPEAPTRLSVKMSIRAVGSKRYRSSYDRS